MPYGGLYLDLAWDAGRALGLELHLEFRLDGGRLGEELRRGLSGRWCLARLRRGRGLLDVDLQGPVELGLEGGLGGGGQDLRLKRRLDPRGTLDLWEGLVWKLHLRMNLSLDLRGRLQRRPLLELDSDLWVDLALCLGLDLLNLAKVLHLDLSADLGLDRGGGLDLDVGLPRARHDRRHRKTLQDLRTGRLNDWNLRSLNVGHGDLGDGDFRLDLRGCYLGHL